jgi:hypothetical protein
VEQKNSRKAAVNSKIWNVMFISKRKQFFCLKIKKNLLMKREGFCFVLGELRRMDFVDIWKNQLRQMNWYFYSILNS